MKPQRKFDTLQYVQKLRAVDFEQAQAEVMAETMNEMIETELARQADLEFLKDQIFFKMDTQYKDLQSQIADSKKDLEGQIQDLRKDLSGLRKEFQGQMLNQRTYLEGQIAALRKDMETQVGALRAEMNHKFEIMEERFKKLHLLIVVQLGGLVVGLSYAP